ncbi:V-type ATPase, G subunit [Paramicrosporidium saccamoebae]|uniref:V-type proton ATPase subunit G n=1 Tax=Paramicrosporidium saccamoebae TaxID=1246581 RepID=A0A2H9TPP5_9FUNG|nr:V-type ATPase, G subunit [Paramicrosporidium saccamoebae]
MSTPATPTVAAPGVQVLLDAEKEANRQIQAARQCTDARADAHHEIEALKRSKQTEYTEYERTVMGSLEATVEEYGRETAVALEEIKRVGEQKSAEAAKVLLATVIKVEPQIHRNAALRMREGN